MPRQYRHDGWTGERQQGFIDALAETGSVKAACARIGKTTEGAYQLRRQPGAQGFRAAWEAALAHGVQRLTDIAIDRAIEGVAVPIFHRGEQVGEKRWYNDRLLMFLFRHHQPARYAPQAALPPGTKHPDTIAREAAEAHDTEAWLHDRAECLAVLARHHRFKVRCAAEARLIGDAEAAAMLNAQAMQLERAMAGDAKLWSIWSALLPRLTGEAPTHAEEERAALGLDPTMEIGGEADGTDGDGRGRRGRGGGRRVMASVAPPHPRPPARAEVEAKWRERDRRAALGRSLAEWAGSDPRMERCVRLSGGGWWRTRANSILRQTR